MKIKNNTRIILFALVLSFFVILGVYITPKLLLLRDESYKKAFMEYIASLGIKGVALMTSIVSLQVILAFLPGEPFEIIAGVLYGPWYGLLVVELGVAIATYIIYYMVKFLHFDSKKYIKGKYISELLDDKDRLLVFVFFITIIPGFPKDLIAYFVPSTNVKIQRFLFVNFFGRIPSILSSTYFGYSLIKGNYKLSILIFSIELIIALLGIFYNKKIVHLLNRIKKKKKEKIKSEE